MTSYRNLVLISKLLPGDGSKTPLGCVVVDLGDDIATEEGILDWYVETRDVPAEGLSVTQLPTFIKYSPQPRTTPRPTTRPPGRSPLDESHLTPTEKPKCIKK